MMFKTLTIFNHQYPKTIVQYLVLEQLETVQDADDDRCNAY
jgi:hypothetical protein